MDLLFHSKQLIQSLNTQAKLTWFIHHEFRSSEESLALIIGEQHRGSHNQDLSFQSTNTATVDLLLALYSEMKLPWGAALKEGSSEIFYCEDYANWTYSDFIREAKHPLEALLHLKYQDYPSLQVHSGEEIRNVLKFIILAILYYSILKETIIPIKENHRLIEILLNNYQEELWQELLQEVSQELRLQDLLDKRIITKTPVRSLYKLMNIELEHERADLINEIKIFRLFAVLNPQEYPELEILRFLIHKKIQAINELREKTLVNKFLLSCNTGIHPVLVGNDHLDNLAYLFTQAGISNLVISPFKTKAPTEVRA